MKSLLKLGFGILGVVVFTSFVLFSPWGLRTLRAAPTIPGVELTNIAQISWNSGSVALSTNVSNNSLQVGTNYGVTWIGMTNLDMAAGDWQTNDTYLTNDGNATADIILSFTSNVFANTSSKVWSNFFSNVSDGGASAAALTVPMSAGAGKHIYFYVFAPSDETNGAFQTFQCLASNSNASAEIGAGATNYVGFNTTAYGGSMGMYNAGAGNAWLTNAQTQFTNWKVTVLVADIVMTKTAAFTNPDPFGDPGTFLNPVPGALITYRISYTNQGGLTGTSVKIVDAMPTNYITYKNNSMRRGIYADALSAYPSLVGIPTDVENDDDGATNSLAADQLVFAPTNGSTGTAPSAGGFVGPGVSGTYFYQVWLK